VLLIPALLGISWTQATGKSMEPTINDGDIVIYMDSWGIKPGDVVVFKTPEWEKWPKEDWMWIKRIDHIKDDMQFWLLGDNPEESYDSRDMGYVKRTLIYKKVLFIIKR
jgi:signal peptidase I